MKTLSLRATIGALLEDSLMLLKIYAAINIALTVQGIGMMFMAPTNVATIIGAIFGIGAAVAITAYAYRFPIPNKPTWTGFSWSLIAWTIVALILQLAALWPSLMTGDLAHRLGYGLGITLSVVIMGLQCWVVRLYATSSLPAAVSRGRGMH